jgi:transcriptional regulator with XRE-family HTH domain
MPDRTSESTALNSDIIVGENIAARRRCLGWTRAKLAEMLYQSDSWVRRVEEGQKLSPNEFYAIAEALSRVFLCIRAVASSSGSAVQVRFIDPIEMLGVLQVRKLDRCPLEDSLALG